jgi:hypothetical protein
VLWIHRPLETAFLDAHTVQRQFKVQSVGSFILTAGTEICQLDEGLVNIGFKQGAIQGIPWQARSCCAVVRRSTILLVHSSTDSLKGMTRGTVELNTALASDVLKFALVGEGRRRLARPEGTVDSHAVFRQKLGIDRWQRVFVTAILPGLPPLG